MRMSPNYGQLEKKCGLGKQQRTKEVSNLQKSIEGLEARERRCEAQIGEEVAQARKESETAGWERAVEDYEKSNPLVQQAYGESTCVKLKTSACEEHDIFMDRRATKILVEASLGQGEEGE